MLTGIHEHEEKGIIDLRIGLFASTMRIHPQVQPKAVPPPQLVLGGEAPTLPGLLERGVAGGSDCMQVPRKPSVQILAGMGSMECTSKSCDYFEGVLLSEF